MGFATNLHQFAVDVGKQTSKNARRLTLVAFRNVVDITPFDTGMAKGNWNCSINVPDVSTDNPPAETRVITLDDVPEGTLGDSWHVTNALPYINRLNNGWSKDAKHGMTGPTMEVLRAVLASGVLDTLD